MITKVKIKDFEDEEFEIVEEDNSTFLCRSLSREDFEIFVSKEDVEPIEGEENESN